MRICIYARRRAAGCRADSAVSSHAYVHARRRAVKLVAG